MSPLTVAMLEPALMVMLRAAVSVTSPVVPATAPSVSISPVTAQARAGNDIGTWP